jgi:hypothetical protein
MAFCDCLTVVVSPTTGDIAVGCATLSELAAGLASDSATVEGAPIVGDSTVGGDVSGAPTIGVGAAIGGAAVGFAAVGVDSAPTVRVGFMSPL